MASENTEDYNSFLLEADTASGNFTVSSTVEPQNVYVPPGESDAVSVIASEDDSMKPSAPELPHDEGGVSSFVSKHKDESEPVKMQEVELVMNKGALVVMDRDGNVLLDQSKVASDSCENTSAAEQTASQDPMTLSDRNRVSNSNYFVVVESADGSQQVLPGDSLIPQGEISLLNAGANVLEGVPPSDEYAQTLTMVVDGAGAANISSQGILMDSNSYVTYSNSPVIPTQQLTYQTVELGPDNSSVSSLRLRLLDSQQSSLHNCSTLQVLKADETAQTAVHHKQSLETFPLQIGNNEILITGDDIASDNKKTQFLLPVVRHTLSAADSNAYSSSDKLASLSTVKQKGELSKLEEMKLLKHQEEQRCLEQSHLEHHIRQAKRKPSATISSNQSAQREDDEVVGTEIQEWEEEEEEDLRGINDETPIFSSITAKLNSSFLASVPGCQMFLMNEASQSLSEDQNCISFASSDECTFSGNLNSLANLHNKLKDLMKIRRKTKILLQNEVEKENKLKTDKSTTCNLLVPFVSSRGRHAKLSGKSSVGFWNNFPGDLLDSAFDEEVRRVRRKRKSFLSGNKRKRANPRKIVRHSALQKGKQIAPSTEGLETIDNKNIVNPSGENDEVEQQNEDIGDSTLLDPLQRRLREEQVKYKQIIENEKLKQQELAGSVENAPHVSAEINVDVPEDSNAKDSEAKSEGRKSSVRKKGRPPKQVDTLANMEKVQPRNPLTESKATKQQRQYEENVAFKYFCNQCSFKTKRPSHYLNHLQLHKGGSETKYFCKQCDFSTISMTMLRRHELKHKDDLLKCDICGVYTTDRKELLLKHKRLKHSPEKTEKRLNCDQCPFTCSSKQGLSRHMVTHNRSEVHENKGDSFQCPECKKTFRHRMHLQRHIRDVHSPEVRPHLCHTCGKAFKRTDALQQHQVVHLARSARSLPFKCSTCNKAFRSQAHLKEHMSRHSSDRPYLCQYCGSAFKTQPVQKKHILTLHIKPRTHVCAVCCRQFNTRNELQRHEHTHNKGSNNSPILEIEKTTSLPVDTKTEVEESSAELAASLEGPTTATLTVDGQTATIVVNGQATGALVQDMISRTDGALDQGGSSLPQTYIQGNQGTPALYYFTRELQNL